MAALRRVPGGTMNIRTTLLSVTALSVAGLGLSLPAQVAAAPDAARSAASAAAGPGQWVQLSSGKVDGATNEPEVRRYGGKLQVVWKNIVTVDSVAMHQLRTRLVNGDGSAGSAIRNVLPPWAGIADTTGLGMSSGLRLLAFSGSRSSDISDPYNSGAMYYLTSSDGLTWSLGSGSMSKAQGAYGSYGTDLTNAENGTPVVTFTDRSDDRQRFHGGIDAANPAAAADGATAPVNGNVVSGSVATDRSSGATWTVYWSAFGGAGDDGVTATRILPTVGANVHGPQSTVSYNGQLVSIAPDQRVGIAARIGGGLYTAYHVGYLNTKKIALWKLGGGAPLILRTPTDTSRVGIATAPGGRLWVFWKNAGQPILSAVRTNKAATRFGRICNTRTPKGTDYVWKTAGDGTNGKLDLVVNAGVVDEGPPGTQIWSTQVLPCLSVSVAPTRVKRGGTVTVTVRDAGDPVKGATVVYSGVSKTTNADGKVSFHIDGDTSLGRKSIRYRKGGYTGGTVHFKVVSG